MSEYGTAVFRLNPRHEGRASHLLRVRVRVRVRVGVRIRVMVRVRVRVGVRVRIREACVAPAARLVQSEQRGGTPSHRGTPGHAPSVLR